MSNEADRTHNPHATRNFWLCVGNGGVVMMGMAFFAPGTVLAGLARNLTDSTFYVGLLISIGSVGWMWPQLFVGNFVESLPRKMPLYVVSAFARSSFLLAMAGAVYFWRGESAGLFWVVFFLYTLFASAGGIVVVPFMDILAKTVSQGNMPMVWAYRRLIGGALGFVAGLVGAYILSERSGLEFPSNYAALLLVGAVVCAVAYSLFMMVREPIEPVAAKRVPFMTFLKRGPVIFRKDQDFRRFFLLRGTWAFASMSQLALFVPMAVEYFGASDDVTGGWFTAIVLLSGASSSLLWGRAAQRFGEVRVMRMGAVLHIVGTLTAITLAVLHHVGPTAAGAARWYFPVYMLMYVCGSAAVNACDISGSVYLLALPSARLRPTYVAFMNTLYVPLLFAPTLAGFLAAYISYPATIALSCAAAVAAFIVAGTLRLRAETDAPRFDFVEDNANPVSETSVRNGLDAPRR